MLEPLLNLLARHRTITTVVALGLAVVGAVFAVRLPVNDSPERWLPASSVEAWRQFERHYTYGDTIAVATQFHRPVRNQDIELLGEIRRKLKAIDGIARVIDVSQIAEQIEEVPLERFLAPHRSGADDPYATYRGILFDNPKGPDPPKERTLLTFLELSTETTPGLDAAARQAELDTRRRRVVAEIYRALDTLQRGDITFHVAGGIVIQHELEKIARRAIVTVLPVALVVTLAALAVGFRSFWALVIAVLGGFWSVIVMLGGVSLAGWTLNVVTVGGPTLMVVIVIATTVHFAHYYSLQEGLDAPRRHPNETGHFLRWVALPCMGAAMVTGVGFLMLAFNELGPARELGIELFIGAVLAFLGALLVWLWVHPFRARGGRLLRATTFRTYHRHLLRHPWAATLTVLVLTVAAGLATFGIRVGGRDLWGVKIDADPFSFFQPETRIAKAFKHFADRDFGLYILDVVLVPRDGPDAGPEEKEKDRQAAVRFQRSVESRPEVRNVISAVALQARQQSLGLDLKRNWKRFMAFFETFRNWTEDRAGQGALRISFMVHDNGEGFGPLLRAVRHALPEDRFQCIYTGTAANVVTLSENLVGGITRGLIVATAVMALLCALLFRSIRLTLVAVLPNALPVLVVFGVMGAFDVPLNSGSAMVATIALGVALTDTVHFVMHYRRRRAGGEATDPALADTFAELGRPIVLTSIVNCVGFAVFLLSDFRPMVHFGLLASIAMLAALVGDLVLLPSLLKLTDRGR